MCDKHSQKLYFIPVDTARSLERGRYPLHRRVIAAIATIFVFFTGSMGAAQAVTKAYEFIGEWVTPPEKAQAGESVIGARWFLDINDDAPAATNDTVDQNIVTFTVDNAVFQSIPDTCVGEESAISEDQETLTCDLGPRAEGTAQITFTGILAKGPNGSEITMTGQFRDLKQTLDPIPIQNAFYMDAMFNQGDPFAFKGIPESTEFVSFPFSVTHRSDSPAGPDTVEYNITLETEGKNQNNEVEVRDTGCAPNDRRQPGYPFSGEGHPAEQTAQFPDCTLENLGNSTFKLTLSNLDYDTPGPRIDSNDRPLALGYDVIAAGELLFQYKYVGPGFVDISADTPNYTAEGDGTGEQTISDNPANNTNNVPVTFGMYTGGWRLDALQPEALPGTPWAGTSLAPVGATVMQDSGVYETNSDMTKWNWVCSTVDTQFLEVQKVRIALDANAKPNFLYDDSGNTHPDLSVWYYTGDWVDAVTGEPVDPNFFRCGGVTDPEDPAAGNPPGWSTEPPADLSTVKAVKVGIPPGFHDATISNRQVHIVIESKIKDDTPVGQDIWEWSSMIMQQVGGWGDLTDTDGSRNNNAHGFMYDRGDDVEKSLYPSLGKAQMGKRYGFSAPMRDMLTTVASSPLVNITVDKSQYLPNEQADYTVFYGLESNMAQPRRDPVDVTVVLPKGLSYVDGSASVEPTQVSTDAKTGAQVLTWNVQDVEPNIDPMGSINFKATVPNELGGTYAAAAIAQSQGITRSDQAQFVIPDGGHTSFRASADPTEVDLAGNTGPLDQAFTLDMISRDPSTSQNTDFIALLPRDRDPRGSVFSGNLTLKSVDAPQGATVYYTTADPADINEDPADPSNQNPGAGLWTTEFSPNATAIRVVSGELAPAQTLSTTVTVTVDAPKNGDKLVLSAVGRADSTQLRMRTSAPVFIEDSAAPLEPPVVVPPPGVTTPPGDNPPGSSPWIPLIPIAIPLIAIPLLSLDGGGSSTTDSFPPPGGNTPAGNTPAVNTPPAQNNPPVLANQVGGGQQPPTAQQLTPESEEALSQEEHLAQTGVNLIGIISGAVTSFLLGLALIVLGIRRRKD